MQVTLARDVPDENTSNDIIKHQQFFWNEYRLLTDVVMGTTLSEKLKWLQTYTIITPTD